MGTEHAAQKLLKTALRNYAGHQCRKCHSQRHSVLYQQEFTDFNLVSSLKLPVDAEDTKNYKANLRIEKRSGTSSDNSGLPNTYAGAVTTINPLDLAVNGSVIRNAAASSWKVSFNVTGFSGFFVKTIETPLPLNLINFTAIKETGNNLLQWTTNEINTLNFEVQRSADAKNFIKIGMVDANRSSNHRYSYHDSALTYGNVYYRLKMIDLDKSFAYSQIKVLLFSLTEKPVVFPNPVADKLYVQHIPTSSTVTISAYQISEHLQLEGTISHGDGLDVKGLFPGTNALKLTQANGQHSTYNS